MHGTFKAFEFLSLPVILSEKERKQLAPKVDAPKPELRSRSHRGETFFTTADFSGLSVTVRDIR